MTTLLTTECGVWWDLNGIQTTGLADRDVLSLVWLMDPFLKLLRENAALSPSQLAGLLDISEAEVTAKIRSYEADQVILAYRTILNEERLGLEIVRAVIEVKITPEREGGFNRLAERIAKYPEVNSCYLMSGGYDLLVIVEGSNM